jgi:hypothetical protein
MKKNEQYMIFIRDLEVAILEATYLGQYKELKNLEQYWRPGDRNIKDSHLMFKVDNVIWSNMKLNLHNNAEVFHPEFVLDKKEKKEIAIIDLFEYLAPSYL